MKKNNIDQRKIGVVLSYGNIIVTNIINVVYVPILLKFLGNNEYGLYSLCMSLIEYLAIFNMGYASAYVRYHAKYWAKKEYEQIKKLNGMFLIIYILIALFISCAGSILIYRADIVIGKNFTNYEINLARMILIILIANLAITMVNSVFSAIISTNEHFVFLRIIEIVKNIIVPCVSIILLYMGYNSVAVANVTLVVTGMSLIGNIIYCKGVIKSEFSFSGFDYNVFKDILRFSSFLVLQSITDCINWQLDKLLLGRICGGVAITYYTIGAKINSIIINISCAIYPVFIPKVHRTIAQDKDMNRTSHIFANVGKIQFIVVFFVVSLFCIWGQDLLFFWLGDSYHESYGVAVLLILPNVIFLSQSLGIEILRAQNRHKFLNVCYIFVSLMNLIISIPLCRNYGAIGAAMGTCIAEIFSWLIIANIYYYFVAKIRVEIYFSYIKSIFVKLIIPIVLFGILHYYLQCNSFIELIIQLSLYSLVYGGIICFWGLTGEEKKKLIGLGRRRYD